ncbi:DUF6308 family protein [Blastococcus sp. URHD0036]|uniref:DUF6308 family protein n=1 Tax=Blastococcus sp. URHD0036 TaxID=1380356 RepID=UPI00068D14BB|nr:DUF6308 family protein [Blastococcus sp. URHD0036]
MYQLPESLNPGNEADALAFLRRYYGKESGKGRYTGSHFDGWGRDNDPYRFTAEDLVAVTFLSVVVKPLAAHAVLEARADDFSALLRDVDPDQHLVDVDQEFTDAHPAWRLDSALRALKLGIGRTISSKLLARKRPHLVPIYDSVVGQLTGCESGAQWEPLRRLLRSDDSRLYRRLLDLRDAADLNDTVPALRVYDVVCWMEGKETKKLSPTAEDELIGAQLTDD